MLYQFLKMKKIITVLCLFNLCFSISFEIQNNSATINVEDLSFENPFTGGINYARISWYDWDGDGDIDLFLLDEDLHFKYFENIGDSIIHNFILKEHPIDNLSGMKWFHLGDLNADGSIDLAVQSTLDPSHVMFYEYNGEEFVYTSLLYQDTGQNLTSASMMTPTFADIDNDGDYDFFSGNVNGTVNYFNNIGIIDGLPVFEFVSSFWENILIVGPSQQRHGASAIRFIDLDGDGDLDLAWGDYFQRSLYIIWNIGNQDVPQMDPENFIFQYPENDPIYTSGQNMPSFADIDSDGDMDLFITVLGGDGPIQLNNNFLMYENIGDSLNPIYNYVTDNFLGSLDLLSNVVPSFVDINNDGGLDFFVGQDYTTDTMPTQGRIFYFNNEILNPLTYNLNDSEYLGTEIGLSLAPEFIDIDFDNDFDLFVGDYNGKIKFYENSGTLDSPEFLDRSYLNNIDLGFFSVPEFCDIDNDNDYDLFIGNYNGQIYFYENIGDSINFNFIESSFNINLSENYARSAPRFVDFDYDNDYDLLIGTEENGLIIHWNIGSANNPIFVEDSCLDIPYFGNNVKPVIDDIDNDGIMDIILGLSTGGFLHYKMTPFSDVNFDYNINIEDIIIIVDEILYQNSDKVRCNANLSHDDNLDIFDLLLLVNNIINN